LPVAEKEDADAKAKTIKMGMVWNKIDPKEEARWRSITVPKLLEDYKKLADPVKAQKIIDTIEKLRKK
jgi:hypothetical protein